MRVMTRNGIAYLRTPSVPPIVAIASGSWPTPRATDGDHGGRVTPRKGREGGNLVSARTQWATPTVKGNYNRAGSSPKSGDGLATQVGGVLNPTWVEWLMGFPAEWTALEHSEIRLYLKSRRLSATRLRATR